MKFKSIKISEWQQFQNVDISFENRLTVLTGANGSGKTSILNILARHSGWQHPSFSTPKKEKKTGIVSFISRFFDGEDKSNIPAIGELAYTNGSKASLRTQPTASAQYHLSIDGQQNIRCLYIPSHRAVPRYQAVDKIPTSKKTKENAFNEVRQSSIDRYFGQNNRPSSTFYMKSALIGWAAQGYGIHSSDGTTIMPADQGQASYFEGFPAVLRKVLPPTLGFEKIEIRNFEIVFVCNGGRDEFILETVSGGIAALIDMAWQIYMYQTEDSEGCTVIIDEVENHLHPTMQRQILGDFLEAFPDVRFIVSTHSPLVVGSVRDAQVYALKYNDRSKIISYALDFQNKAKTAAEVLDEVLGVSVTMPIWAEKRLNEIVNGYAKKEMNETEFNKMRKELSDIGLQRLIPSAITKVLEEKE